MARYEYKIPCDPVHLPEVEGWIRLHPVHWRVSYPGRQVNNVYFDSHDLTSLNANLSGSGRRQKLRLRWYGSDLTKVREAHMELKCKDGRVGWKEIAPFDGMLDLQTVSWPELMTALRGGLESRACHWLEQRSEPVLVSHYQRAYYESADGTLRLTLDTQLRAFDQRVSLSPNLSFQTALVDRAVVEIKAPVDEATAHRLSDMLTTFPIRVDRFSKYVYGLAGASGFDDLLI